jgi:hypothetical protein
MLAIGGRVARFFLTQYTKTEENIPINQKITNLHQKCKIYGRNPIGQKYM